MYALTGTLRATGVFYLLNQMNIEPVCDSSQMGSVLHADRQKYPLSANQFMSMFLRREMRGAANRKGQELFIKNYRNAGFLACELAVKSLYPGFSLQHNPNIWIYTIAFGKIGVD